MLICRTFRCGLATVAGENAHNNVAVVVDEIVAGFDKRQKSQLTMTFLDTPVVFSEPAAHPSVERLPNWNPVVSPVQGDIDDADNPNELAGRRSRREKKIKEVFKVEEPKETKNLELMEGAGEKLRDIPNGKYTVCIGGCFAGLLELTAFLGHFIQLISNFLRSQGGTR